MINPEDVEVWCWFARKAHAVMSEDGGYRMTACGTWGNMPPMRNKGIPKRICKECRRMLKRASKAGVKS